MKKGRLNLDKIFAIAVLLVLLVSFIQLIAGAAVYKILDIDLGRKTSSAYTVDVDWKALYPFTANSNQAEKNAGTAGNNKSKIGNLLNKYRQIADELEVLGDTSAAHMFKYSDIATCGYILNALLSDPGTGGDFVRLNNGYWTTVQPLEQDDVIRKEVNAIVDFYDYLEQKNIPMIYVQPPMKNCQYDSQLPIGVEDYTNENIDNVLNGLDDAGIEYLDLRKNLHEEYDNHYELFYMTDHHWTFDASFWAYGVIENELHKRFNIDFGAGHTDLTEYRKQTYEKAMFGSAGSAVTHFIADSEDFSVYFPLFETNFKLTIPDKDIVDAEGTFEEIFVNYPTLENIIGQGGGHAYETMLYGNRPFVQIKNPDNENGPKVLMLRDSYSIGTAPYLALDCSELDLIDTRPAQGNFTGSVRTYIEQTNPDIVIMMISQPWTSYK